VRATRHQNQNRLTGFDRHLVTRTAYAMVVTGLWGRVEARRCDSFDFYEIVDSDDRPRYRIGRFADGGYGLLDLRSGLVQRSRSLGDLLRSIAYVPRPAEGRPVERS